MVTKELAWELEEEMFALYPSHLFADLETLRIGSELSFAFG